MKIKCCWLYHDIMDLYGDSGNIAVLKERCKHRDIEFIVDKVGIGEPCDFNIYDLVVMGGGADSGQNIIYQDLLNRKDSILNAYNNNTFFLLICGAYQLFGNFYKDSNNNEIPGLEIGSYYTVSNAEHRCVGNIVIDATLDDLHTKIIGFENHGGQTYDVDHAIGDVLLGYGNNNDDKKEGYYDGRILGTYVHGPLLPNNPEIADFLIYKALSKKKQISSMKELKPLDDSLEQKSREVLLNRYL